METACDWVLGLAIPVHMHISTNAVVTDYVPKAARGAWISYYACTARYQAVLICALERCLSAWGA